MTSPKGWDTAEAARLRAFIEPADDAFLHSLACVRDEDGELVCACTPARVRETWDNECAREVATDIDSRGPGLSDFPQQSGSLRLHRREVR